MKVSAMRYVIVGAMLAALAGCAGSSGDGEDDRIDIEFGDREVGSVKDESVTIMGIEGEMKVSGLPALPAPFSIVNDECSNQTVTTADWCTFTIRFAPATTGYFSHTFDVPTNAANKITVSMRGNGITSGGTGTPPLPSPPPQASSGAPVIGSEARGLIFDTTGMMYISTAVGKLARLEGNNLSTFVPAGSGTGLEFGNEIRFSQGHLYVQNTLGGTPIFGAGTDTVLLFTDTGGFVRELIREDAPTSNRGFTSIAVNSRGQLYVAGIDLDSTFLVPGFVSRIDADGQNLKTVLLPGEGGVFVPTSLAIDSEGNVYVGDPGVVSKFDADGVFLGTVVTDDSGIGGFEFASHLAVDRDDNLYVGNLKGVGAATQAWNVLKFRSDGVFQGEFVKAGAGGMGAYPNDMGFDAQAALYVADSSGDIDGVARFTSSGSFDRLMARNTAAAAALRMLDDAAKGDSKARHYREIKSRYRALREAFHSSQINVIK